MDPPVHNFYDYDQTLDLPAAGCLPLGFGDPTNRKLGVDYAESVRVGDFNGDGLQDLLLLNVEVDVGTEIYFARTGYISLAIGYLRPVNGFARVQQFETVFVDTWSFKLGIGI